MLFFFFKFVVTIPPSALSVSAIIAISIASPVFIILLCTCVILIGVIKVRSTQQNPFYENVSLPEPHKRIEFKKNVSYVDHKL